MEKNFNDIPAIEAFLEGRLTEADRSAFEQQLAGDETLRQEVAAYRQLFGGFRQLRADQFAADVSGWAQEARTKALETTLKPSGGNVIPIQRGAALRSMRRWVAVAASVVLLLGVAAVWRASQQYNNAALVAEAYSPPMSGSTMGGGEPQAADAEKQFAQAHAFFKENNYAEAGRAFQQLIKNLENNPAMFDALTRKFYLENSRWTLALAQFAAGQTNEADFAKTLDAFANDPAGDYAQKAKQMKQELGSLWRKFAKH